MRTLLFISLFFLGTTLFGGYPVQTYAQQWIDTINLTLTPSFPTPRSEVSIALDAYTIDTAGAVIRWYVDGVERTENINERSISVTTGELGEVQVVLVHITLMGGGVLSASTEVIPSGVDLIIESESYIPPFYKGRALPSDASIIRAIAIPQTKNTRNAAAYSYLWEYNGSVLLGGPVTGKSSISLTMPRYSGYVLAVTVRDEKGRILGNRNVQIDPVQPEFLFYEENPLRGLGQRALVNPHTLTGEETTIHGVPYFMNTDLTQNTTAFEWRIDDSLAQSNGEDPNTITLRRMGGGGSARIELQALTKTDIPQYLKKSFSVLFN